MQHLKLLVACCCYFFSVSCHSFVNSTRGYKPTNGAQHWDFVDVREGAHMFYWLYYTQAPVQHYTARPLVLWLDGGPGLSSSGTGNFLNIGPLHLNGTVRNHSWVQHVNVLFVDSPVGAGFSYVDDDSKFATNNTQIAKDLLSFMKVFYMRHTEFEPVPLHIFSYSYGGKMASEFTLKLYRAIQRQELRCQLKSITLGNPWVSPVHTVRAYAPYLLQMGYLEGESYIQMSSACNEVIELIETGQWLAALKKNAEVLYSIHNRGINIYNVLRHVHPAQAMNEENRSEIRRLMRGPVTKALKLNTGVKWAKQSDQVMEQLIDDVMRSAVHIIKELLEKTPIRVTIYTGQFDLICNTPGTVNWIRQMSWPQKRHFLLAKRRPIVLRGVLEGYQKGGGNLKLFWVNRAGHSVARDNIKAMNFILRKVTNYEIQQI